MRVISLFCAALLCSSVFVGLGAEPSSAQLGRRITPTSRIIQMRGHWVVGSYDAVDDSGSEAAVDESGEPDVADEQDEPGAPDESATGSETGEYVLGTLNLAMAADGTHVRRFAVTMVRAYHDADGGMEIFRKACLRPAVNVRGRGEMLTGINAVPEGTAFSLYGQFATGSSELLVSSIELPDSADDQASE